MTDNDARMWRTDNNNNNNNDNNAKVWGMDNDNDTSVMPTLPSFHTQRWTTTTDVGITNDQQGPHHMMMVRPLQVKWPMDHDNDNM